MANLTFLVEKGDLEIALAERASGKMVNGRFRMNVVHRNCGGSIFLALDQYASQPCPNWWCMGPALEPRCPVARAKFNTDKFCWKDDLIQRLDKAGLNTFFEVVVPDEGEVLKVELDVRGFLKTRPQTYIEKYEYHQKLLDQIRQEHRKRGRK